MAIEDLESLARHAGDGAVRPGKRSSDASRRRTLMIETWK
jgi:hypothetical protein